MELVRTLVARWKQFSARARHFNAEHARPVGLVYGVFVLVVFVRLFDSVVFGVAYAMFFVAQHWWIWRPRGIARRNYERWCERMDPANRPVALPGAEARPGWYADPQRRYRVRYWTGTGWT
jgi:hypothetical protein